MQKKKATIWQLSSMEVIEIRAGKSPKLIAYDIGAAKHELYKNKRKSLRLPLSYRQIQYSISKKLNIFRQEKLHVSYAPNPFCFISVFKDSNVAASWNRLVVISAFTCLVSSIPFLMVL